MPLDARLAVTLTANQTNPLDLISGSGALNFAKTVALLNGIGLNQADKMFTDQRTIAASATDSLDFAGSALTDVFGAALTFVKLKLLVVSAATTNVNSVLITRPATNGVPLFSAAGDAVAVRPGGIFVWAAPDATAVAVTAATGDLIDLINSAGGTSVVYDVIAIGTSA